MTKQMPSDHVNFLDQITKRANIQGRIKSVLEDKADDIIAKALKQVTDDIKWNNENPEREPLDFAARLILEMKHASKPKGKI